MKACPLAPAVGALAARAFDLILQPCRMPTAPQALRRIHNEDYAFATFIN